MRKYRTDWKIAIVFAVGLAIWTIGAAMEAKEGTLATAAFGMTTLLTVVVLLITWLSYATIPGHTLQFVYLLFYRRTIDIRDITEIDDQPTYKVGKSSFRSVYIFYETRNKEIKYIELRVTIFPEKTLGRLIRDLKHLNPKIKLNGYCEKLGRTAH
jgi:hypothetical protein